MEDQQQQQTAVEETVDDALRKVGSFGKYQKLIVFFVILPAIVPSAFHSFNQVFIAAVPDDYYCRLFPDDEGNIFNLSSEQVHSLLPNATGNTAEDGESRHSRCRMYDIDYKSVLSRDENGNYIVNQTIDAATKQTTCIHGYHYDQSIYHSSVVTEWYVRVCCDGK